MLKKADEPVTEIPPDVRRGTVGDLINLLAEFPLTEEEAADWLRDIEEARRVLSPDVRDPWES